MDKKILIDGNYPNETRVALIDRNGQLENFKYLTDKNPIQGNIYLAKVVKIEPALQAAFISYAEDKSGFLPFNEIHPDYYDTQGKSNHYKTKPKLNAITIPEITSQDLLDSQYNELNEQSTIAVDLNPLENIETETELQVNIEIADSDIEPLPEEKLETNSPQSKYNIQEVIKKGQILLVQAQKEERGNKAAYFSTYISLLGKYAVLLPNTSRHNGISRRIASQEERKRLKSLIADLLGEDQNNASVILRTSSLKQSSYEIKRDYGYLVRLWNKILAVVNSSNNTPAFIHMEEDIIQRAIRDLFDHSIEEVVIQGNEAFTSATNFMRDILHAETDKIKEYKGTIDIFSHYKIEDQITQLYQPVVILPSGGYIVINPTEALVSIDVNSGKSTSENNIEETALKTNLEAAKDIARQLRLRDISGLIVIDFIDMYEARNRRVVERHLKNYLSIDKAKIQVSNINNFGLLEMSRQRLRPSFLETHTLMCGYCNGKGLVRSERANSLVILRTIENELVAGKVNIINIFASQNAITNLFNNYKTEIAKIEDKHNIKLNLYCDLAANAESFAIEKIVSPQGKLNIAPKPAVRSKELFKLATKDHHTTSEHSDAESTKCIHRTKIPRKHTTSRFNSKKKRDSDNHIKSAKPSFLKEIITKIVG